MEDSDTKVLTYSEIKAIATGDTRFLQRAKLEGEIARLETLKRSFESQRNHLKQDVHKNLPRTISHLQDLIPRIEQDAASLSSFKGTEILEYAGRRYDLSDADQKKAAIEALPKNSFGLRSGDVLGHYNGLSIVVVEQQSWSTFFSAKNFTLALQGKALHRVDSQNTCLRGRTILELCKGIASSIPGSLDEKKEKLCSNEAALAAATELLDEPFDQEETLVKLKQEYEEVTRSLTA